MKIQRALCLLFLQLCCFFSYAQHERIPFEHIGIEEGLSESNILNVMQDSRGFMWFGSWDGLNKYDGYKITVFKNNPANALSLSNNYINQVAEDRKANLWIATIDGLNYFDRAKETFRRYRKDPANPNSLGANNVNAVLVDKQNKVWIGTTEGLDCFDPSVNLFKHFDDRGITANRHTKCGVKNIYEDYHGNIWISNMDENGISVYHPLTGSFTNLKHTADPNSPGGNNINAVFEDSKHRIWLGTNGRGLDLYNEKNNSFTHFTHDDKNPNSLAKNVVLAINEDDKNNLWISTENGGITVFNYEAGIYNTFQHDEIDRESISNNSVYCIYKDNKGNMWLGNFAGWVDVALHDKLLFAHYKHTSANNSLANNQVLSIMEDRKKNIWLCTDGGGLDKFNGVNGNFEHFRHKLNDPATICGDNVLCTLEDSKGNIWVGTWVEGITVLNPQGKVIRHYRNDPADPASLSSNNAWKIFEDRDKQIWIGTYGGGLELLNPDGKTFTHYYHGKPGAATLDINTIVNIFEDKEGILWLCSESKGLIRFDKKKQSFTRFVHQEAVNSISNNYVNSVFEDSRGRLWIGTMNGLNYYDKSSNHFFVYTSANGLAGDYVFRVLEDEKKELWISTNNGLSHLDPVKMKFENYSVADGVQSNEFKQLAACKTSLGEMYFGGINGFNRFFPGKIKRQPFEPRLVITSFTVFNKPLPIELNSNSPSPLKQTISETNSITLPYSSTVFSFEFATLNYTGKERKRYAYMLEGFDKTWIESGTVRTATYTNLEPGNYVFKVRGLNNEGEISDQVATIAITITPPFWQTWWFRTGIFIIVASLIIVMDRYRLKLIKQQKIVLEEQVAIQTFQLKLAVRQEHVARQEAEAAYKKTILVNEQLERSEHRYSTLFYESPQPKWVFDIETLQFINVNKAAVDHYGYSEEEFLTMNVLDLNPTDERLRLTAGGIETGKEQKSVFKGRYQHIKKCGELIQVEIHSSIIHLYNRECILFIAEDITEKIAFENKLSKAIIKTQEDERYEIGGELHDNVCQLLISSQMNITRLNHSLPKGMVPYYESSKLYLKQAMDEIRNLSHRLAPAFFGDMTLEESFKALTASVNVQNTFTVSFYFHRQVTERILNRDLQLNLYRVLQEELKNIIKHANASEISVDLMIDKDNNLVMQTSDNGIGFDAKAIKDGIGMANMKRRAELFSGKLEIDTSPGRGCCITITIPLPVTADL